MLKSFRSQLDVRRANNNNNNVSNNNSNNNNGAPRVVPRRRKSLPKNNFRGITREEMERQTSIYLASMTVSSVVVDAL